MSSLKYLFIDFNAYFAGVEQHDDPAARGRPLIVTPLKSDHTGAIAASYEARQYGIRRGTTVREARQLCPEILVRHARHDRYVEVHQELMAEIENHLPVTKVYSIDECACLLAPSERPPGKAVALATALKEGIVRNVGPALRSSIGLAPSRLLAKLAAESRKPDGLTVLRASDLPHRLVDMPLTDIPGVGAGVSRRLERAGVTDFLSLWNLQPKQARALWGSVQGERFWYSLHGHEVHEEDNPKKSMIGHSRVLTREHEQPDGAKIVARALLLKAASRLRHYDMFASSISLGVRMRSGAERGARWDAGRRFSPSRDTFRFMTALDEMWTEFVGQLPHLPDGNGGRRLGNVTVYLHGLAKSGDLAIEQGDLFADPEQDLKSRKREKLWAAIDAINADLDDKMARLGGKGTARPASARYVTLAAQQGLDLNYLGAKIAFSRVPEKAEFLF